MRELIPFAIFLQVSFPSTLETGAETDESSFTQRQNSLSHLTRAGVALAVRNQ